MMNSGFAKKPVPQAVKELSETAFFMLQSKEYFQAYLILKDLTAKEKTVFNLFNISLCFLAAGKPADAAAHLEEALNLCKKELSAGFENKDSVASALENAENSADSYKAPLPYNTSILSNEYLKNKTVRVLIDAYLLSDNKPKLESLVNNPAIAKYANVKAARVG